MVLVILFLTSTASQAFFAASQTFLRSSPHRTGPRLGLFSYAAIFTTPDITATMKASVLPLPLHDDIALELDLVNVCRSEKPDLSVLSLNTVPCPNTPPPHPEGRESKRQRILRST
jgi:hypothetical protein